MAKPTWRKGIPLDEKVLSRLRDIVREKGEKATAELLGIGSASIVRAAAGLGLRRGTIYVIESKLGRAA